MCSKPLQIAGQITVTVKGELDPAKVPGSLTEVDRNGENSVKEAPAPRTLGSSYLGGSQGSPSRPGFRQLHLPAGTVAPAFRSAISDPVSQPQLTERKYLDLHLVRKRGHDYSSAPTLGGPQSGSEPMNGARQQPQAPPHPIPLRPGSWPEQDAPCPCPSATTDEDTEALRLVRSGGWKHGVWGLTDPGDTTCSWGTWVGSACSSVK